MRFHNPNGHEPDAGTGRQQTRLILTNGQSYRSVTVSPLLVACVSVLGLGILVWCVGLSGFVFFRDDVVRSMVKRHAVTVEQYEDRITSLRLQVDSIRSRQFINQDSLSSVIEDLRTRQDQIEADQSRILGVVEQARQAGLSVEPDLARADAMTTASTSPADFDRAGHSVTLAAGPTIGDTPVSRPAIAPREALVFADTPDASVTRVARQIDEELRSMGDRQSAVLNALELQAMNRVDTLNSIFGRLRLDKRRFGLDSEIGVGGPFIKVSEPGDANPLALQIARVEQALSVAGQIEARMSVLPINRPLPASYYATSSSFGNRIDPFLRRRAFHSGLDFRAPSGTRVYAAAAGRVTKAGRNGGYGNLVEIDHGNGLTTRYAHMSRVLVRKGQKVTAGDTVGKVGSTGRSTGPHLHYEIRVDGDPVNPVRFLTAL